MERDTIVREYFELRDSLNRSNKISNQRTDIEFEMEQTELFQYCLYAVTHGQQERHRLAIAERNRRKIWERTGNTIFKNFEEFCADFLNHEEDLQKIPFKPSHLPDQTQEYFANQLSKKIKMLLLDKSYEP